MATRPETVAALKKIVADIRALDVVVVKTTDLEVLVAAVRLVASVQNFEIGTFPNIDTPPPPPPPPPPSTP